MEDEAAKLGFQLFCWKPVCTRAERDTGAQQEADCRGGGSRLDAGMELNSLGWVLWRRAQAPRENARKSVLAPQNKNMLTKSGPQTGSLNQELLTALSVL